MTDPGTISVVGHGRAEGVPDLCRATLVATAVRASVVAALQESEDAAARMRAALTAGGVERRDAPTAGVDIRAEEEYSGGQRPTLIGYRAEHTLAVVLRDLASAGRLLGEAIAAGGDAVRLRGVVFTVDNDADLRDRARAAAWADARHTAKQLVALAGGTVGRVVTIDASESRRGPRTDDVIMAAQKAVPESIEVGLEPGAVSVESQLAVVWELG